jgi:hypothetical protein
MRPTLTRTLSLCLFALCSTALVFGCTTANAEELNLDNAAVVLHRTAQLKYESINEGRGYGAELINTINAGNEGLVRALQYEEQFGQHFRLHWLILFKDLESYAKLRSNLAKQDNFLALAPESIWSEYFVQSSIQDQLIVRTN